MQQKWKKSYGFQNVCSETIDNLFVYVYVDNASIQVEQVDERVVKMYWQVKDILTKYRSGKLPKAFKIIPSLRNWEQVCLTRT